MNWVWLQLFWENRANLQLLYLPSCPVKGNSRVQEVLSKLTEWCFRVRGQWRTREQKFLWRKMTGHQNKWSYRACNSGKCVIKAHLALTGGRSLAHPQWHFLIVQWASDTSEIIAPLRILQIFHTEDYQTVKPSFSSRLKWEKKVSLIFLQINIVFRRWSKRYWFAIPTCFSAFFSKDVSVSCMAALCYLTAAECRAACLVACLFSSAHETGTIHFSSFITASSLLPLGLTFFITLSIFCWNYGADRKLLCVWLQGICKKEKPFQCHFGFSLLLLFTFFFFFGAGEESEACADWSIWLVPLKTSE